MSQNNTDDNPAPAATSKPAAAAAAANTMSQWTPLDGGCICGHARYRLNERPLIVHGCHCTVCQRETGGPFALNAVIESEHVEMLPSAAPSIPGCEGTPNPVPAGPRLTISPFTGRAPDGTIARETEGDNGSENKEEAAEQTQGEGEGKGREPPRGRTVAVPTPSESRSPQIIHRCPLCATAVWSHYGPNARFGLLRYLRAATLDQPWRVDPDVHIFTRSKRSFLHLADGKPQFDTFYDYAEAYAPESLERLGKVIKRTKAAIAAE